MGGCLDRYEFAIWRSNNITRKVSPPPPGTTTVRDFLTAHPRCANHRPRPSKRPLRGHLMRTGQGRAKRFVRLNPAFGRRRMPQKRAYARLRRAVARANIRIGRRARASRFARPTPRTTARRRPAQSPPRSRRRRPNGESPETPKSRSARQRRAPTSARSPHARRKHRQSWRSRRQG